MNWVSRSGRGARPASGSLCCIAATQRAFIVTSRPSTRSLSLSWPSFSDRFDTAASEKKARLELGTILNQCLKEGFGDKLDLP